ncbi:hypothetical protein BKA62DRAFT_820132 [Auriculariales sp. MPI-PUGE-AT-0066]|nr:hypothetical protein BKA62DRAFT_820132 [Auriculariales sp. MPI-PUGE-AT-0066]
MPPSASPLSPHWVQPSHPELIELCLNRDPRTFESSVRSKITLPSGAVFAKLTFPPCTFATKKAYSTVQISRTTHIDLNSDLYYFNHSCNPSLELDVHPDRMEVRVARTRPEGLKVGDELSFFYPSTEWEMAQPFECKCNEKTCRGRIAGAKDMGYDGLAGLFINRFIEEMLREQEATSANYRR